MRMADEKNGGKGKHKISKYPASNGTTVKNADYEVKLLLLGDSGVGKTSIMHRYSEGEFPTGLLGTAGVDFKEKITDMGGKSIKLQLWDTAGQEKFRTLTGNYFHRANGIILVYDVTDRISFENISDWMENIKENGDPQVEILLIGNKVDLIPKILVGTPEGQGIASAFKVDFLETSALSGENVDNAFIGLTQKILHNPRHEDICKKSAQNGVFKLKKDKPGCLGPGKGCC